MAEANRLELEKREQAAQRLDAERRAAVIEEERAAQAAKQRRVQARQALRVRWQARIWGTRGRQVATLAIGCGILGVAWIALGQVRESRREQRLIQAVNRDDWDEVLALVEHGAKVNTRIVAADGSTSTLLMDAIARNGKGINGSFAAVKAIIEYGADVNVVAADGTSPLEDTNDASVAGLLLSHGARADFRDTHGRTPLFYAACINRAIFNLLMEKKVDVNARIESGDTPLHQAAGCNQLDNVKDLIAHGADVNSKNKWGGTPLARANSPAVTAYLKEHGAIGEVLDPRSAKGSGMRVADNPPRHSTATTAIRPLPSASQNPQLKDSRVSRPPAPVSAAFVQGPVNPDAKSLSATPATDLIVTTLTCAQSKGGNMSLTLVVNLANKTVNTPHFGSGQDVAAQITDASIAWQDREVRNYGGGGVNVQDFSLDRATGVLTEKYKKFFGIGVNQFNCN